MPETGKAIEIHASFRFTVTISDEIVAAFGECSLPNLEIETLEVKEGGQNEYSHRLPVRVKQGTLTLRYGLTRSDKLLKWYVRLLHGLDGDDKNFKDLIKQVSVTMYDSELKPVALWNFEKAYPVKWKGPTLKTDQQALAIEELEFAFHGFSVGDV